MFYLFPLSKTMFRKINMLVLEYVFYQAKKDLEY